MKRYFKSLLLIPILAAGLASEIQAQVDAPAQYFTRGKLWQSVYNGKIGPTFNNWRRSGVGLDWPGFDATWIVEDIGGAPSHLATGGIYVACRKQNDSVLVAEDWSISGGTVSSDQGVQYKLTKHTHLFKNGENYWLKKNPDMGEEVIQTQWEYNLGYTPSYGLDRQMPVRVTRTSHNWSGSKREENYIIHEYVIKNISSEIKAQLDPVKDAARMKAISDTLKDFYVLLNYAMHSNTRAWNVNFPTETPGAKNTWYFYEQKNNLIYGKADDYYKTAKKETAFGYSKTQGKIVDGEPQGEFLAPGFAGFSLLYASPNKRGETSKVQGYGWSAGDDTYDYGGPFVNMDTEEMQYQVVADPSKARNFSKNINDTTFMRMKRIWSMMNCGPWDLKPGDSIVVAVAEVVDGIDYSAAIDPATTTYLVQSAGKKNFDASLANAKFTYNNHLRHPNPPAAPENFKVDYYREKAKLVANQITWGTGAESLPDPDDGVYDLTGYRLYRSSFLPIGPWELIGDVKKGDGKYMKEGQYSFVDSLVNIGTYYYYAITSYDSGRTVWNINPSATFTETGTTHRVPSLESSIFANRMTSSAFLATLPANNTVSDILVVPNPFVSGQGNTQVSASDEIQFVNLPNPCTIRIYTVRGDLVKTINVQDGNGAIASWNQLTDYGQFVESGIYIFHVESSIGNKIGKFAIVR